MAQLPRRDGLAWLAAFWGVKRAGQASVTLLPHSVDEQIGELAIEHMDYQGTVVTDPVLKQGWTDHGAARAQEGRRFHLSARVVDASIVNAFAFRGTDGRLHGTHARGRDPEQLAVCWPTRWPTSRGATACSASPSRWVWWRVSSFFSVT